MNVTAREKALAAATLMALLYGLLGLSVRGRLEALKTQRLAYRAQRDELNLRNDLIARREQWERQYGELADLMPVFEADRRVDTHWLGVMDRLAAKNQIAIVRRQIGEEKQAGGVFEMPIECKEWEGTLEALTGFLYDLQSEGAMLDVRQMHVRPAPGNPGRLRGSFTLNCAYMRAGATPPATPVEARADSEARTKTP